MFKVEFLSSKIQFKVSYILYVSPSHFKTISIVYANPNVDKPKKQAIYLSG